MNSNLESVRVAADWWGNKIQNQTATAFSNGETDAQNQMASFLAFMLANADKKNLTDDQVNMFRETLNEYIEKEIENYGMCNLKTDYEPEGILAKSASDAHIPTTLFPYKTSMRVTPSKVEVSEGYGNAFETIYSAKTLKK